MLGRTKTRLELWEEHLKDPVAALEKALNCPGIRLLGLAFGSKLRVASLWVPRFCKICGKGPIGKASCLDPWDSVRLRTASTFWNVPGKYGPHGELFVLLHQEAFSNKVPFKPVVPAEMLKACALMIGLHLLAAEGEAGSSGRQFPDLGDM